MEFAYFDCGGVEVACPMEYYNGRTPGGYSFGRRQYLPAVRHLTGKVNTAYEFCCGPGFIGFSLLAEGLCDELCLSDIDPRAIKAVEETIRINNLGDRVRVYLSDVFDSIPDSEQWDLVVVNPPHFFADSESLRQTNLRLYDPNWSIHDRFYSEVGNFLSEHGSVLVSENAEGSHESFFIPQIEKGNLTHMGTYRYHDDKGGPDLYYMWSKKSHPNIEWLKSDSSLTSFEAASETFNKNKSQDVLEPPESDQDRLDYGQNVSQ